MYCLPVHPLKAEVLKASGQAIAVVNGNELPGLATTAIRLATGQDVASIAVSIAQAQVQHSNLVHLLHREAAVACRQQSKQLSTSFSKSAAQTRAFSCKHVLELRTQHCTAARTAW